jgi:hypothetical protein
MISLFDLFRKIKNYFTDRQETETVFESLAKLPKETKKMSEPQKYSTFFKNSKIESRAQFLTKELYEIMIEMCEWAKATLSVNPVVCETVTTTEEDKALGRSSVTHQQGRAFDLRTRDWTQEQINLFMSHFTDKYGSLGAIGSRTGKPTLIVYHNAGHGPHFHIQLKTDFSIANLQTILKERGVA